jgi:CRISPR-associated protein Cmr6
MSMRRPIIQLADRRGRGQHPGLILQRFLTRPVAEKEGGEAEKRALLGAAIQAAKGPALHHLYQMAFARWTEGLAGADPRRSEDLKTAGRLIVGLGSPNVLEAGIRLHHTYGLPFIPGSVLKGLSSRYCAQGWGQADANRSFRRGEEYHKLLFGATGDRGVIVFHDAWILPESVREGCLLLDVMTSHHPDWAARGQPPTDFDRPHPIAFLSVAGTFRVAVSWAGPAAHPQGESWTELAFTLLKEALREWGAGGRTSSGYGRLAPVGEVAGKVAPRTAAAATPAPPRPTPAHERGQRITVTRIADPKGKVKFQADDGCVGHFASEAPPAIEVGQTTSVWIANVSPQGYTFTQVQPKVGKPGGKPRGR